MGSSPNKVHEFLIYLILPATPWPWGAFNKNEYQMIFQE
jgi:hypothetical protein